MAKASVEKDPRPQPDVTGGALTVMVRNRYSADEGLRTACLYLGFQANKQTHNTHRIFSVLPPDFSSMLIQILSMDDIIQCTDNNNITNNNKQCAAYNAPNLSFKVKLLSITIENL